MVIYDTASVNITFQEQDSLILIRWLHQPDMVMMADAYLNGLQFVCKHPNTLYFCTDQSVIGPLDRELENWLLHDFYPSVYRCLEREIYAAVVFSDAHFKAIVTHYQATTPLPQHFIHFNYFACLQEALQWLSDVKKGQEIAARAPSADLFRTSY
ncbi:hypothetical protein POKO110462_11360 [Pontibacter korlensis]|uniref:STAS/SEC14 domain-containing protein n=1 Tax=Pontibacter korlensis TaxID=400092 RepID=A0A0E3UYM0_9BACT|nr:hypothetical protein [Pontibacter korlensis]AKD04566.1 hypothetical protein PKOR_17535 [Pontibacter korlensis]